MGADATIRLWDVATRLQLSGFDSPEDPPLCCTFLLAPASRQIAVGFRSGRLRIFDAGEAELLQVCAAFAVTCVLHRAAGADHIRVQALAPLKVHANENEGCNRNCKLSEVMHNKLLDSVGKSAWSYACATWLGVGHVKAIQISLAASISADSSLLGDDRIFTTTACRS